MKKIFFLFISTLITLLASCSKFEDGPWISFRSEEKRLVGDWTLKSLTVDGVDSLSYWNNYFESECTFSFKPPTLDVHPLHIDWIRNDSIFYKIIGNCCCIREDLLTAIYIQEDKKSSGFPLWFILFSKPRGLIVEWKITRLKYKELWFQMDVNDKHYELQLERIGN